MERASNQMAALGGVLLASLALGFSACGDKPDGDGAASSLNVAGGRQPDRMIGGKRYVWVKKAAYVEKPADHRVEALAESPAPKQMSAQELAEAIRPVALIEDNEYILAEPDIELATRLLAGEQAPSTEGHDPTKSATDGDIEVQTGKYIIGADGRSRVGCARTSFPSSAKGKWSTGCSATMIGPHTAAIAAHCVYNNGWIWSQTFTPAKDAGDMPSCPTTDPFGHFGRVEEGGAGVVITKPSGFSSNQWNYDYASIHFSDNPGDTVGWVGTWVIPTSGDYPTTFQGYPGDKPSNTFWGQSGNVNCTYRYGGSTNCVTTGALNHLLDIWPGDSGGGIIRGSGLIGIQSTESYSCTLWACANWNTARTWTSTLYAFFSAGGDWP